MICMIEGCQGEAVGRGLCPTCYQAAHRRVKRKVVTWDQLVKAGLARQATHSGRGALSPFALALEKKLGAKAPGSPHEQPVARQTPVPVESLSAEPLPLVPPEPPAPIPSEEPYRRWAPPKPGDEEAF